MKSIGMYMALAGLISIVLNFMNMNLRILMWIDSWGESTGWIIRGGLLLVGAAIYFMSPAPAEEPAAEPDAEEAES